MLLDISIRSTGYATAGLLTVWLPTAKAPNGGRQGDAPTRTDSHNEGSVPAGCAGRHRNRLRNHHADRYARPQSPTPQPPAHLDPRRIHWIGAAHRILTFSMSGSRGLNDRSVKRPRTVPRCSIFT